MLASKVWETVYVKYMFFRKIALLHLFQQQRFLIARISFAEATDRIIGSQNQRQLMELLGQCALGLVGGMFQILRRNAAALEFIHRVNHAAQKFRLRFHGSIGLQLAV